MNFLRISKNQNGIALLVALTVITVLVSLSLALYQKMNASFDASVAARQRETLSQMTSSGIHVAMAMLIKDHAESTIDSVQEDWADPEKIEEALQVLEFDDGKVSLAISDERSRIQVNALVYLPGHDFNPTQFQLWVRLIEFMEAQIESLGDMDYMELINSLKDWIDSGDDDAISGLSGAESSYYEDLDPPYYCRNAPLDYLGDLARVKGFPPGIFSPGENMPQISDVLTVQGMVPAAAGGYTFDGKININTANVIVLTALLPEDVQLYAQNMVAYRSEKADETYVNDLSSPTWYKNVSGLEDLELDANLITTSSDLFRITSSAASGDAVFTTEAVVLREADAKTGKWHCKILYWQNK